MKKTLLILTFLIYNIINAQNVYIPDLNFKNQVLLFFDANGDNEIQISEAENIVNLYISSLEIHDLTGIEYFTNLSLLDCKYNSISTLDVSSNTNLTTLDCEHNLLTSLDVSNNLNLDILSCGNNSLTILNINDSLRILNCSSNVLTTLDLSNHSNLYQLYCNLNHLNTLNIGNCNNLYRLDCSNNLLNTLDVYNLPNLKYFSCNGNSINTLDINNSQLSFLNCENNSLISINVNSNLNRLFCSNNLLSTLDVSNYSNLEYLWCDNNLLNTLDVSYAIQLFDLKCGNNAYLEYLNLRNGNNTNMSVFANNTPNLSNICIDDVNNSDFIDDILTSVGHDIDFTENCTLSTSENTLLDFSVYPTPTENILNIKLKTEITKIEIYSKLGQLIINTTENKIDISNLTQGLYFVKVEDVNGNFGVKKIVKK